ncbi:MAG: nitrogen fixation protein NifX [Pseudomonas sp.]|uniref:NifB/NifX family molybdenum-iron cluster-binding protein n=1 Tax=Thalassolituus oleivorans TaxID=187493 RepID=UPI001A5D18A0|nr:NifB/NifX family molybdenum-iron cluster-binding protein [Thalassolituus oleivorans]MBL4832560.1 nitrogen fixation protein NifX [Pseudomonas sp.]|tara:strand:- start:35285 stop:35755 length:471 start_codon:yes stop_codon:yes gene_type:complete
MAVTRHLSIVDGDHLACVKVAFASSDREEVDEHFGSASSFAVYAISPDDSMLVQVTEFGHLNQDGNEDKLKEKFTLLQDCVAVYCRACGASAVRQLMAMGIQPVKVSEGTLITDLVEQLQQELREGPSAWLARAIRSRTATTGSRFDEMESEGWNE